MKDEAKNASNNQSQKVGGDYHQADSSTETQSGKGKNVGIETRCDIKSYT